MRVFARLLLFGLPALAGCAENPYVLQGQVTNLQQQQSHLARRNQELQSRASTLDRDNQELETLLAQSRQQAQRLQDHVAAVQDQLRGTTSQLAQLQEERRTLADKAQAAVASTRRRASASITANSSLAQSLPAIALPGVEVRQDGELVRIELPADRLFDLGTARLAVGAGTLIDGVAVEISRAYPDQMVGIEGHTDSDPLYGRQWGNNHQLSTSRAATVFDYLTTRARFRPEQLFVIGHGPNHPVVSNATPSGKARNRRVELVVYPEKLRQ